MNLLSHPDGMSLADDVAENGFNFSETWDEPDLFHKLQKAALPPSRPYEQSDYLVVMPSVREIPWEYFWPLSCFNIFVCDDSDGKANRHGMKPGQWNILDYPPHYAFANVFLADRDFTISYVGADNLCLFPNHNPSVKNIGLYYAVKEGYKAVILLDDDVDCRERAPADFMTIKRMVSTWDWSSGHNWVNTLGLIKNNDMWARGFPYEYRKLGFIIKANNRYGEGFAYPYFNEGLWTGHPDINGIDKLEMMAGWDVEEIEQVMSHSYDEAALPWYIDPVDTRVSPGQVLLRQDQNLPLSIMNCQIDASLIPAFWQPSDYDMSRSFKIRRHDDIWSMYFLRKIMAYLGADVTVGEPLVNHRKRSNVIGEILSEHHTNLIQPHLCNLIDIAAEEGFTKYYDEEFSDVSAYQVALMANEMSSMIRVYGDWQYIPGEWKVVLQDYFKYTQGWSKLFFNM
jgi:hypothetical protein